MGAINRKKIMGFTLIEVLIALAIVAFTIPAFLTLMMSQTDNAGTLRNKAIATWIAENTLVRLRLERKLNESTLRTPLEETVTMAGVEWRVFTEPEETEVGALLRYRTKVGFEIDEPLVTLDTYVR